MPPLLMVWRTSPSLPATNCAAQTIAIWAKYLQSLRGATKGLSITWAKLTPSGSTLYTKVSDSQVWELYIADATITPRAFHDAALIRKSLFPFARPPAVLTGELENFPI
jgi:hypothetical protein